MRKFIYLVSVSVLVATVFSACRKYEEGPNVSLRSKEARVTNNWKVESADVNGIEESLNPYWAKQKHYFRRNGDYQVTIIDPVTFEATNLQGSWKLYDASRKIALTTRQANGATDSIENYNILKLFNKQMWIRRTDNLVELHFVPFE